MRGRRDGEFGSCFRMMVLLWLYEQAKGEAKIMLSRKDRSP